MKKSHWVMIAASIALIGVFFIAWRATQSYQPVLQRIDQSPESLKSYRDSVREARQAGYLKSYAAPAGSGSLSMAFVSPAFMALDYDDKEEILKNLYSIYFNGTREADHVLILDSINAAKIGKYRPCYGLLKDPEWTRSDKIALWQTTIGGLGTIIIIVGLGLAFWELRSAAKSLRMSTHIATADAVNDINMLIAGDQEIRKVTGETPAETLAHVRLNRFEQMFLLSRDRLIGADAMKGVNAWVGDSMKKPEMRLHWPSSRRYFSDAFGEWIDSLSGTVS